MWPPSLEMHTGPWHVQTTTGGLRHDRPPLTACQAECMAHNLRNYRLGHASWFALAHTFLARMEDLVFQRCSVHAPLALRPVLTTAIA
jgi:hypothetical protein